MKHDNTSQLLTHKKKVFQVFVLFSKLATTLRSASTSRSVPSLHAQTITNLDALQEVRTTLISGRESFESFEWPNSMLSGNEYEMVMEREP